MDKQFARYVSLIVVYRATYDDYILEGTSHDVYKACLDYLSDEINKATKRMSLIKSSNNTA
jgi:hypothetical protein